MVVKLFELDAPLEAVEFPDGTEHQVKRFDGFTAQLWMEWGANAEDDPRVLWQIAARCVPSATDEQIQALTASQAVAVVTIAAGNVEKVLAAAKNGDAGALIPETPAPSSPVISSAPSSSPLPAPPDRTPAT